MNLRLAFNWDEKLLDNIGDLPVKSMFGILPSDVVGGGRPTAALRKISKDDATTLIKDIRKRGISFNYLLNAVCLDNKEYTREWTAELVKHLEWLVSCGVDSLTVSIPYLIQFIKKHYPDFKISTSIFDRISTVERARYFEDLGVDDVVLDPNINRELKLIGKMRKALNTEMTMYVNGHCLYQCPFAFYHAEQLAHSSQSWHPSGGYYTEYCWYNCMKSRLEDPGKFIRSIWVRPEDLEIYEDLGINNFKVGDRTARTEYIVNTAKAYAIRRLEGNLTDLFNIPVPMIQYTIGQYMEPDFKPELPYIDNRALDGFLEFFRNKSCAQSDCDECRYCDRIAEKAVTNTASGKTTATYFKKAIDDIFNINLQ